MRNSPLRLIVMGVSGCGKSTMATALGQHLGLEMVDGDDLHHPSSVAKMRAGIALEDADRWPWLDRIGDFLAQAQAPGRVVACSALKLAYRNRIREQAGPVRFLFLNGSFELIDERLRQRVGHYMQANLLASQFQALEIPQPYESDVITMPINEPVAELVNHALKALQSPGDHAPSRLQAAH
jgi:carbohydrate kinase (thermoresistant glucokinase family)